MNPGRNTGDNDPNLCMPIANVGRIMKHTLPERAKIADEAKEAIQECVSEFLTLITRKANAVCQGEYRNTITPDDLLSAMESLGFDNYIEPLTIYLENHQAQDPDREPVSNRGRRMAQRVTAQVEPPVVPEPQSPPPPPALTSYYVPPSPPPPPPALTGYYVPPPLSPPPPPARTGYYVPPPSPPPPVRTGYYVPPPSPQPPPAMTSYYMHPPPPPSPPEPTGYYVPAPLPTGSAAEPAYEVDNVVYVQALNEAEFDPFG